MTFWPLTNSDYPTNQTFHQFHDLNTDFDLHRITSGFHGAFATGVACKQGTLTLPDTWFRPPFLDLLMLQLWRPNFSNLPCLYSTFHFEYPLVLSRFCLSKLSRFGDKISVLIHIRAVFKTAAGATGSYVTATVPWNKNGCQNFSYVHSSRKHWKCKYSQMEFT